GLEMVDRPLLRQVFATSLQDFELRLVVPALVYRINRCRPSDVSAVGHYLSFLTQPAPASPEDTLSSPVLAMNVSLSEMAGDNPPSLADVQATDDGLYFSTGLSATLRSLYDLWPRYTPDAYSGAYPKSNVPLLMLNGTLDPQTPIDLADQIAMNY